MNRPPSTKPAGKILVIRGGAIGDFVLTLPVLTALRQRFPESHLEVLGYPHIAALARAGGLADNVRGLEERGFARFFARGLAPEPALAAYFAGFHLILSYLYDPDGIFEGNVTACSGAQFIAGPHRPDEAAPLHATEVFLKPLERLAIFEADPTPRLAVARGANRANHATVLALHPGSGSYRKNWPEANWRRLLQQLLAETPWHLLLIGGEAEAQRIHHLAPEHPRVTSLVNRPLPEVAAALAGASGFAGHDSGIAHLAAAVGLPGVALWGPSNPTLWSPRSPRFRILQRPGGLGAIPVESVLSELRTLL